MISRIRKKKVHQTYRCYTFFPVAGGSVVLYLRAWDALVIVGVGGAGGRVAASAVDGGFSMSSLVHSIIIYEARR